MLPSRRGHPARVPAALALLLATAATGALAACGDSGGLESAGAPPATRPGSGPA